MSAAAVFKAINAVTADLSKVGISKDNTNQQQKYKYRGIDDVYNVLGPLLAKHGLSILPQVLEHHQTERQSKNGGTIFHSTVKVKFTFVAAEDASCFEAVNVGEAFDSADKGLNKAVTAAYKYLIFQSFAIPVVGQDDADAQTIEVESQLAEFEKQVDAAINTLNGARDLADLKRIYVGLRPNIRNHPEVVAQKDAMKEQFEIQFIQSGGKE